MSLTLGRLTVQSKGFSPGFSWMYWPSFKPEGAEDDDEVSYGSEQSKKELYSPSSKHGNFKEEILAYPTMTKRIYNNLKVKVDEKELFEYTAKLRT